MPLFTLESKICSKDFIFAQFNLFRESSIYDLSWAVHLRSTDLLEIFVMKWLEREIEFLSALFMTLLLKQLLNRSAWDLPTDLTGKKSPRNFMRSLFFLPECEYWVHKSNLPPVVLDNFKFYYFVFYNSLRCKFTSYDQTSTVFDSSFPKIKLYFPTDLDQHKF